LTKLGDTAAFGSKLRQSFDDFRRYEELVRDQYKRDPGGPDLSRDVLERTTRRFLVDRFLDALDWNPDDIQSLTEEARAKTGTDDRLYFDYLGLEPTTRAPVLLFEAKGFDVEPPRRARQSTPNVKEMASVIAEAVDALKNSKKTIPVISAWAEFLADMRTYVCSLDALGQSTLKRAVMSSGQWIIIFTDPWAVFGEDGATNIEHIRCYNGFDDILARKDELHDLLHRTRLVDTLALTLKLSEALEMFDGKHLDDCFRAAIVTTTTSTGARKHPYPARLVYPALLITTGGRWFAVADLHNPVSEPVFAKADRIDGFLTELKAAGEQLEGTLSKRLGRSFDPLPIERFPGFDDTTGDNDTSASSLGPIAGSTAHRRKQEVKTSKFVTHTGEAGGPSEFVVVTGDARFYKLDKPRGSACVFHFWKDARANGEAAEDAHVGYILASFTEDGQDRHCANGLLVKMRGDRCKVEAVETHLCCQACLFADGCWPDVADRKRLPCPPDAHALGIGLSLGQAADSSLVTPS
jgi:hypothetical protein